MVCHPARTKLAQRCALLDLLSSVIFLVASLGPLHLQFRPNVGELTLDDFEHP